jgi:3-oxoacyl-[acyl-carrier-protein] synthase III
MGTHWLVMDEPGNGAAAPFSARLAGAGRHLPATHLTTHDLMATTRHKTHIDLERLTGIHERRVSVGDEDSYSLATKAALKCLVAGFGSIHVDRYGDPVWRFGRLL